MAREAGMSEPQGRPAGWTPGGDQGHTWGLTASAVKSPLAQGGPSPGWSRPTHITEVNLLYSNPII